MSTANRIRGFIEKRLTAMDGDVTLGDEDDIFELGFVDSLFALELVTFLETELDLQFSDEDLVLDNFRSINAILNLLNDKG